MKAAVILSPSDVSMFNIYEMYKRMENDDIILAFKGDITEDLLTSVFQIMESRLEVTPAELRIKKKVNNILVECLQNVYHHMEDFTDDENPDDNASAMFIICQDKNNAFRIITGNHILNTNIDKLKQNIDHVNGMSESELKANYIEALKTTELSAKGGAGLGMMDMARKSGRKLEYRFDPINDRIAFFSLMISIA